jgi:V-type H+-transporting ATPase subunit C
MPSDLSYWIISAPLKDGDPGIMLMDVRNAVGDNVEVGQWEVPELKVGHLLAVERDRWQSCLPYSGPLVSRVY